MRRRPIVRPWDEDEVAELRRLWMTGVSKGQIARRLRRGVSSVEGKARMVGLPSQTELKHGRQTEKN
jgi:hypothetical protein